MIDIKIVLNAFVSICGIIVAISGASTYLSGRDTSGWAWKCTLWAIMAVRYVWL